MNANEWFKDQITWSTAEKKAARRAFDLAYQRQCAVISENVKKMIATTSAPSDIWQIHDYLSEERKMLDEIYDYRYSVLLSVFSRLLRDGWLTDADLLGLQEDKIERIKRWASL
jgi:hypothetical protein